MVELLMLLVLLSIACTIIGLVKPTLILKFDSKPTRLKAFTYGLVLTLALAWCGGTLMNDEYYYNEGMKYYQEADYELAVKQLQKVESSFISYPNVLSLIQTADSLLSEEVKKQTMHERQAVVQLRKQNITKILASLETPDNVAYILLSLTDEEIVDLKTGQLKRLFTENESADSLFKITLLDNLDVRSSLIEEAKEEKRKEQIQNQFGWGGRHIFLTHYIKENMHDPDSFDHVETQYSDEGDHLRVFMKFRGTNSYGITVISEVAAKVASADGMVLEVLRDRSL